MIIKIPKSYKPSFRRYMGIDYSGAKTPDASLKDIRVYQASRENLPVEMEPPPSQRLYWTRRGLAEWLVKKLSEDIPTMVGIDHGFPFHLRYFEAHHLEPDWNIFLMIFRNTGQRMKRIPMLILSGMAQKIMLKPDQAMLAGDALQKYEPGPFTSMCPVLSLNPRMQGFRGCVI